MSWADIFSALSTGAQIAGAISSVSNAYRSAEMDQTRSDAQKAANEAQAVVADNNAQLATWQAMDAIYRGQVTENQSRLKTASLKSTQRVRMAAVCSVCAEPFTNYMHEDAGALAALGPSQKAAA